MLHRIRQQSHSGQTPFVFVAIVMVFALSSPKLIAAQPAPRNRNGVEPRSRIADSQTKIAVDAGEVKAHIALSEARPVSGQRVGVVVDFDIAPGWHVYGKPLPEDYTPTSVIFDNNLLSGQNLDFPKPTPVKFDLLGETLPVYQGHFKVVGNILLRHRVAPGEHRLGGTLSFQECNDNLCKMPQQVRFEIPLWIDSPPSGSG